MENAKNEKTHSEKLYDVLQSKQAPANHTVQPAFANDIKIAKMLVGEKAGGVVNLGAIFGHRLRDEDETTPSTPINLGSKSHLTFNNGLQMPEETRFRLFMLKKAYNDMEIQACFKARHSRPDLKLMKSVPLWGRFERMAKAFDVTDFDVWIDQVQARFYFEEYEIPLLLSDEFDSLPMTSPIVRVPGALGLLEGELESDDGSFTEQANTKSSYLVESKNNVVHVRVTQDLLDDTAPPIIDKIRKEVVKGIARAYERAILDGDASGTHIDDDYQAGSAKLFVKAFNGLRKRAFDNETTVGSSEIAFDLNDTPSKDMFSGLLKRMKCQGSEKNDLAYIYGCTVGHDLVTGAIPELFTAFAFGSLASNVTGQVPPVFGIKSVESEYVREDLETDGKADNPVAGATTYCLLVQKSRFMNWVRQATKVWAAPSLPSSDFMLMSGKARHAFAGIPQSADERSVVMAYNVKTS